jgi:hypothetical protein
MKKSNFTTIKGFSLKHIKGQKPIILISDSQDLYSSDAYNDN